MKLETFKVLVEKLKIQQQKERAAYQIGIDLLELTNTFHEVISILVGSYYGKEGLEIFEWWCFEKDWGSREDLTMRDKDNNELCKTIEGLHEYLEKNRCDDYELSKGASSAEDSFKNTFANFNK